MTKIKHHYIPRFHLALFTQDGTKDSNLWVFDQLNGNQRESVPGKVGFQKHLYSIELPGSGSDVIEDVFAEVERHVAPIIRNICHSQKLPDDKIAYSWLINYIALLAERTPIRLEHFTKPIKDISKILSQMIVSTPERFEATMQSMKRKGMEVNGTVSYEEMRDFVLEEKYTISVDNNTRISTLMNAIDAIIPYLGARNWVVVYSPPEIGDFICSDNPVSLHWITQEDRGIWSSPGHGCMETEVSVPLSSRIMLLGRFEDVPPNIVITSKENLAILNSFTGMHSDRFIYSKNNDFLWFKKDQSVGNVDDFKQMIFEKVKRISESGEDE